MTLKQHQMLQLSHEDRSAALEAVSMYTIGHKKDVYPFWLDSCIAM